MKTVRIIAAVLLVVTGIFAYNGYKNITGSVLENIKVKGTATAQIVQNFSDPNTQYEPIFENDEVAIIKEGASELAFVTESGINVSASFPYSFSRCPEDNSVTVVYDKTNPMRFTVKDFDQRDWMTALFWFMFALMFGIFGVCALTAAIVLAIINNIKENREDKNDTEKTAL
ncbi:MAG: hypothetical protein IJ062_04180 [Firmicutes bacterium]|nr:hypothetical protein [Bacillota bacterium]